MAKVVYRMCLAVMLLAAVAVGIYYYRNLYGNTGVPEQGIFVKSVQMEYPGALLQEAAA